ncbi:putative Tic20 family protein [Mammaliicoccus lentus]
MIIIGIILLPILAILVFIFTIIGAVKAYQGETYLPPLSIRFIK